MRKDGYDAVISSVRGVDGWNRELANPPEVATFNVRQPGEQGIDLNLPQMGQIAVELLYMDMQHSLVERRALPFRVHVPGRWVEADEERISVRDTDRGQALGS